MIDKLIAELTLDEKALLSAGRDNWTTSPIDRVGIPSFAVTDGPNGARGSALVGGKSAVCVPCGSALAATWDPDLVEAVGAMLGQEARTKACRVLLAPTVNIHRSPLAGRNFECYSEDPLLAGRAAAAFVRGVQSQGVVTTVKHFAGNEAETLRMTDNSIIGARALREIYLVPFELAVREGGALGVMTAYNRLNGVYCAENEALLDGILRGEWDFDGFVLTDWFAAGTTTGAARAGLDLEMPGPGRFYGPALATLVRAGELDEAAVDAQVRRLLGVFDRIGAFDDPPGAEERAVDLPEHRALARRAASDAMTLLKNDGVLPFAITSLKTVAVVGPNADRAQIMGGGSASLRPHYLISPVEALRSALGDRVDIRYERGCDIDRTTPALAGRQLTAGDGSPGLTAEFFSGRDLSGDVLHRCHLDDGRLVFFGDPAPGVPAAAFSMRAAATFTAAEAGAYTFTLVQAGRARVFLDGQVILDGVTDPPPPGPEFFGTGSVEMTASVDLASGQAAEIVIEYSNEQAGMLGGVQVGCRRPSPPDLLDRAVAAAAAADAVVCVVGTTGEWESEGRDRTTLDLPGDQDQLVAQVVAANRNTVVVLNAGAPVAMPWAQAAPAVLATWFGGQEMANALVDVLTGDAEPAGRLPTTFPTAIEHTPSFGNFPGENGATLYGEGVLVGYRWYEARKLPTLWPFGHGLSYTTFTIGEARASSTTFAPGGQLTVEATVTNTGARRGAEVVQCYVSQVSPRVIRPPQELRGFAKVWLGPGETASVRLELDDRAFAYWDPGQPEWAAAPKIPTPEAAGWRVDPGRYELHIGRSSTDIAHIVPVEVRRAPDSAGG